MNIPIPQLQAFAGHIADNVPIKLLDVGFIDVVQSDSPLFEIGLPVEIHGRYVYNVLRTVNAKHVRGHFLILEDLHYIPCSNLAPLFLLDTRFEAQLHTFCERGSLLLEDPRHSIVELPVRFVSLVVLIGFLEHREKEHSRKGANHGGRTLRGKVLESQDGDD